MLLAFGPEDLQRLAGPIGILVGILTMLAQPQMRAMLFKGQPPPTRSRFPIRRECPKCGGTSYKLVPVTASVLHVKRDTLRLLPDGQLGSTLQLVCRCWARPATVQ